MSEKSAQPPGMPSQTHDCGIHLVLSSWQAKVPEGQPLERWAREGSVGSCLRLEETRVGSKESKVKLEKPMERKESVGKSLGLEETRVGWKGSKVKLEKDWHETGISSDSKGIIRILILTPSFPFLVS